MPFSHFCVCLSSDTPSLVLSYFLSSLSATFTFHPGLLFPLSRKFISIFNCVLFLYISHNGSLIRPIYKVLYTHTYIRLMCSPITYIKCHQFFETIYRDFEKLSKKLIIFSFFYKLENFFEFFMHLCDWLFNSINKSTIIGPSLNFVCVFHLTRQVQFSQAFFSHFLANFSQFSHSNSFYISHTLAL